MTRSEPFIIGVAGGTGSGKTTVTQKIFNQLDRHDITILNPAIKADLD